MGNYEDLKAALKTADTDRDAIRKASLAKANAAADAMNAGSPTTPPPVVEPEPEPEPPTPTPTDRKIGQSISTKFAINAAVKSFGTLRYFFQPGEMRSAQTWSGHKQLVDAYTKYGCRSFSISFKPDGSSGNAFTAPNNITNFLKSCPADAEILTTYYHEHDGNIKDGSLSISAYTQGCNQLADLAHAQGKKFGPIHNGMVYDSSKKPAWGLYDSIWKKNEAPLAKCDFWGADCYSPNYEEPSPRMDALATYAKSINKPLLIGELSSPYPDQAKQAAWAAKARTWADKNATWAHWWHSQVSADLPDYHMSDAAAKQWYRL